MGFLSLTVMLKLYLVIDYDLFISKKFQFSIHRGIIQLHTTFEVKNNEECH